MLGGALSIATASAGGSVAWIVPTYKNGRAPWRFAENVTAEARAAGVVTSSKTERVMEFPHGGMFGIYSGDNEDSIRGDAFHLVILDEAARISQSAWQDAIQPTLADYGGEAILISTPKGLNWFYDEWQQGQLGKDDIKSWSAPSNANPSPLIRRAFELARDRVPARTFQQEWMAEFVADGAYFQNVNKSAIVVEKDLPDNHKDHTLFMSADWGKSNDYSCFGVGCRECNRVVDWEHFNKIDYIYQRERLNTMRNRWKPRGILPERNSMGEPNVELLVAEGWPVLYGHDNKFGFYTGPTTKPPLIEGLAQALVVHGFQVPIEAKHELTIYEVNTSPSGHPSFSAPDGMHDDWVMMLALLWRAMTNSTWFMS